VGSKTGTLPQDPPPVLRPVEYDTVYAASAADRTPKTEGGLEALKEVGIGGRVYVQFVVSPRGRATNVRIDRHLTVERQSHPDLEREARRVIMVSPFNPGQRDGEAVPVRVSPRYVPGKTPH